MGFLKRQSGNFLLVTRFSGNTYYITPEGVTLLRVRTKVEAEEKVEVKEKVKVKKEIICENRVLENLRESVVKCVFVDLLNLN